MSSRGKKKTTMAKLSREAKLRERRYDKAARKEARRESAEIAATQPQGLVHHTERVQPEPDSE